MRGWWVAGGALLAGLGSMAALAERLSPEQPPEQRPLLLFCGLYAICWAGYAAACHFARRSGSPQALPLILAIGLAGRGLFLPSALIQSDDCYRYILDGQSLLAGINPYRLTPEQVRQHIPDGLINVHGPSARQVIARVNNPEVPTLYPPLALATFAAGAALAPWQIIGQRVVLLGCDLLTLLLLLALLRQRGFSLTWIVLYAWNPLIIKEIANSAHADSLAALWLVAVVAVLLLRNSGSPSPTWWRDGVWSATLGATLGGAVLAKLYPALLAPCCVAWILVHPPRRLFNIATVIATGGAVIALGCVPFLSVGLPRMTEGLRTYSEHWINNAGAFELLVRASDHPRAVAAVTIGGIATLSAVRLACSQRTADDLVRALCTCLLGWLLWAPACFPWYAVGPLAVATVQPRRWAVVLTGCFGCYYGLRYAEYQGWSAGRQLAIRAVEHGTLWLWLLGSALADLGRFIRNRRRPT